MSAPVLGIIGGTGLTELSNLEIVRRQVARTPYGEASGALTFGRMGGIPVIFLARHGYGHTIAPHQVNYRANLWALHAEGVTRVVSIASVGGIAPELGPGTLALPNQILDYTWGRKCTFFEGPDQPVTHVDFTHPYCPHLRAALLGAAAAVGEPIVPEGVYATTQGPRLETAAEIDRLERDGATMVGMTGMPEAALARELSLSYATIAVVANHAAGRGTSSGGISLDAIRAVMQEALGRARRIVERVVVDHERS
ncbi:MAG: S-methyl-5'-thioinosine phosphorylase [Betaproteobacteria bacterium]|nr:S-methyl-5'-thioinosine phosphorylase [Betaproteobacteria bacterium]